MRKLLLTACATLTVSLGLWLGLGGLANAHPTPPKAHHSAVHAASVAGTTAVAGTTLKSSTSKTASSSESESSTEGESNAEPPGEPTPGHEDPNGQDVNHDCSPENPSGCDTANGEIP